MSYKQPLHIVHTWRDGTYIYQGVLDIDTSEIGALIVGEKHALIELYEIRHLAGKTTAEWGELFHWTKTPDGKWSDKHLGKYTEEGVRHDYKIQSTN